jgi:hypothetical protein
MEYNNDSDALTRRAMAIIQEDDDSASWALNFYFVDSPSLAVWCGFIGFCSLVMLLLTHYMFRHEQIRRSIYMDFVIIFTMVQCIYDTLFTVATYPNSTWTPLGCRLHIIIWYFFGILCSGFSFSIVVTVLYVVETHSVPTNKFRLGVIGCNFSISLIMCSVAWKYTMGAGIDNKIGSTIYTWTRDSFFISTIIAISTLVFRVWKKSEKGKSWRKDPMFQLIKRLIAYPTVQLLSRSGTIYTTYLLTRPGTPTQNELVFSGILATITEPIAGIGGLLAFLIMQDSAWANLKQMIRSVQVLCGKEAPKALPSIRESIMQHDAIRKSKIEKRQSEILRKTSIFQRKTDDLGRRLSEITEESWENGTGTLGSSMATSFESSNMSYDFNYEHSNDDYNHEGQDNYYEEDLDDYDETDLSLEYCVNRHNYSEASWASITESETSVTSASRSTTSPMTEFEMSNSTATNSTFPTPADSFRLSNKASLKYNNNNNNNKV